MPFATAGDASIAPSVFAVHNGLHRLGVPTQFAVPAAEYAYNFWSSEPT